MKDDLRFTPSTAFETYPWPSPTSAERQHVAEAARDLINRRQEISRTEQIGLTALYNRVDEGAYSDLFNLHKRLDAAVADCYHWPRKIAQDRFELLQRIGTLNQQIGQGVGQYDPF